jgi:cyclophilin family peptidyl-prolyl cis-trans isomerase
MEKTTFSVACILLITLGLFALAYSQKNNITENSNVLIKTTLGDIELELFYEKAPVSVENFLSYVRSGFYNGLVFHRVIPGFMIQGGGFDKDINQKETRAPIINEAKNGLSNRRGTIAYARTPVIKSATSQFFINLVNNTSLDYRNDTNAGYGYAVFGKVVQGMEVVDKIAAVKTGSVKGMRDVPVTPIIILEVRIIVAEE